MERKRKVMREEISLQEILRQLYSISGIMIDVYNLKGESLAKYPDQGADFCRLVGSCEAGRRGCERSNAEGFQKVRRERKVAIYQCHMGLYEAVVPLYHYGTLAGYMMTGQMMDQSPQAAEAVLREAKNLEIGSPEEIADSMDRLVRIDEKGMEDFVTLCRICADYITNHHQFPVTAADTAKELCHYLEDHYREEIRLEQLCRWFGYSKTRLNQLFREYTGTSIYHYVLQFRLEQACQSLRGSEESIYAIAMKHGFGDQNYFSRLFKKYKGCSPGEYRKMASPPV